MSRAAPPADRVCDSCGRTIAWRRAWARDWEHVRWCSAACRRRGIGPGDVALEQAVLAGLAGRRRLPLDDVDGDRESVRRAARRLAAAGRLRWSQGGRPVDPSTARGPVEVSRP